MEKAYFCCYVYKRVSLSACHFTFRIHGFDISKYDTRCILHLSRIGILKLTANDKIDNQAEAIFRLFSIIREIINS